MGAYLTPDYTGQDPLYKSINNAFVVYEMDQVIEFKKAVYAKSLDVQLVSVDQNNITLIKDVDWVINKTDEDTYTMSRVRLKKMEFDELLVKSITIIKPIATPIKINVSFQMIYPLHSTRALYSGEPVEFTPDSWIEMIETVKYHDVLISPVKDLTSIDNGKPRLLEPDPYQDRPENIIEDEFHEMNTPNNIHYIHPMAGAFYPDTLEIIEVSTNTPLVNNRDYVIFGPDEHKTRMTDNKHGVYKFILLIRPIIGLVKLKYWAYGGDVTLYDHREIQDEVINIIGFLNKAKFLTPETIGGTSIVQQLAQRLIKVEERMRRLCKIGTPSYGDVTGKGSRIKKISSPDTNLHWWTIASLYKVDGSDDIIVTDRFNFRFRTVLSELMFDAMVSVNLANKDNRFSVDVSSDLVPKHYVPFKEYEVDQIIYPQLRVIWNENTQADSGALLQVGLELKSASVETLAVEDMSGYESCWKLFDPIDSVVGPEDEVIELPAEHHVWSNLNNPDSKLESTVIPFKDGHLIWAGAEPLNRPGGWKNLELDHYLTDDIDITRFRSVRLEFLEEGGNVMASKLELVPGRSKLQGSDVFSYQGQQAQVTVTIAQLESKKITLTLMANIESGSAANQLDLCHVIVFT